MNRRTGPRALRATVAGCCGWLLMHVASAQAATLDLELGAEHSDNITRTTTDERSETIGTARVAFGLEANRPRLQAKIDSDVQYRSYFDNSYDDNVLGGLAGEAQWSLLPERFVWVVEENYGQIAADRRLADTPGNREDFNFFSTGPDLTIPFGARTFAQLSGRWSDVYYGTSAQGSESLEGTAALGRRLSEDDTVSLNGSVTDIQYDEEALFEDSRISEGFVRLDAVGARTTLSGDFGYTKAERGEQSSDGALVRLEISRLLTPRTTLSLNAGSQFADTASAFRLDQVAAGVGPTSQDAVAATDVFRDNYAYLSLITERERTTFSIVASGHKERHETQTLLDRDSIGGALTLTRRLSSRMDLDMRAGYTDEEFVANEFAFNEWFAGVGLGWRITQTVSMRVALDHYDGTGDGAMRDYQENRGYIGIRYSVGRRER